MTLETGRTTTEADWAGARHRLRTLSLFLVLWASPFLVAELAARWYFWRQLPSDQRDGVHYALYGPQSAPHLIPKVRPNLWSNYEPNPSSPEVGPYGWRWGGGPKKSRLRILALGGSTTWGDTASSPQATYPARMEHHLRRQGFDLDVINGGAPYYTTAELIGTLQFRGIHAQPDIVLIHEGGNDAGAMTAPGPYQPDYSHWRVAGPIAGSAGTDACATLRAIWRVPFYLLRVPAMKWFGCDPFFRATTGVQVSSAREGLLATNDLTTVKNIGYEKNLISLVAITRAHGALPVFITFNSDASRLWLKWSDLPSDPEVRARIINRSRYATDHSNRLMIEVAEELRVPLLPFHEWHPSNSNMWVDHCHLNDQGEDEKGRFVGDWLVKRGLLTQGLGSRNATVG